jgi:HlyD family secretion protein
MRIPRKYLIWAASGGLVGVVGWLALRDRPLEVDTAPVRQGTLRVTVDAEGKTRVRDRYVVTAPVAGRLQRIDLPEGAHVSAGTVVARIAPLPLDASTSRQAEARVAAAQSLVRDAETRVRQSRATLEQERRAAGRVERLVAAGALAEREREDAALTVRLREEDLAAAEARLRAAAADVDQARASLLAVGGGTPGSIVVIRAPTDGCVLRIAERSERILPAGAPVLELGDPRALELVVDVLSSDAARIARGATVIVDGWGTEEPLTGHVRTVEPAAFTRVSALGIDEQRVNVVIDMSNWPAGISDGYRVDAHIIVAEQPAATIAPVSALFRTDDGWAAFVVDNDRAAVRAVRIGMQGAAGAQVLDGLRAGDRVIVFPSDQVTTGRRVTPAR